MMEAPVPIRAYSSGTILVSGPPVPNMARESSGSWIAFEGSQVTTAENPHPDVPPEDCEDQSGEYAVERFQIPLSVNGDNVSGSGQDGIFRVEVSGQIREDGLQIVFSLEPIYPGTSGQISSSPTLLSPVDP